MLLQKFEGCMVGALLGDCLGERYEFARNTRSPPLQMYFDNLEKARYKSK